MSGVSHDLYCSFCKRQKWEVIRCKADWICNVCGNPKVECYDRWGTVNTDLFATPQFSNATGEWHSSQRDKERKMADLGYYGCGDKNHGSRPDLSMRNSAWSYSRQHSHISTGEGK